MKVLALVAGLSLLMSATGAFASDDAEPQLELAATGPSKAVVIGNDISLEIVLSTDGDQTYEFQLGGFCQAFGIYLLGPWGPIQPDTEKILPQNWMHQQHSTAAVIRVSKGNPYRTTVKVSDYFRVDDSAEFKAGTYQVNVKFYDTGLNMSTPIDSGPMRFELVPKE